MSIRISPPKVFPMATGAARPAADAGGSLDSHRQTSFVLDGDLAAVLDGLNLEGGVAAASTGAKSRTQAMVAALGLWSRSWSCRLEALHAVQWGNYAAATPLVRSAADFQASMLYLLRTGAAEWQEWLDGGGIAIAPEHHATQFALHAFRAGEILAAHEVLGPLYRVATDLSLSHFGSTLLVAGNESGPDHVAMTFGDRDFHMGLAEIHLGWLTDLGIAQADALREFDAVFEIGDGHSLQGWRERAGALATTSRCRIEPVEVDGVRRYLVHNWRREPRSAPKRLLL